MTPDVALPGSARDGRARYPTRFVVHVIWLALAMALVVVGTGLVIGGAVGFGLSWLVNVAIEAAEA